jgi:hypothetical protein
MRISWGRREFERTCDECGTAWRVPKAIAKPKRGIPFRGNAATIGMSSANPGQFGPGPVDIQGWDMVNRAERNLPGNAAAQQAAEDMGRCPGCGSEEYSQRPFRP